MIITIDGPSGTGKSTVAKGLAKALGVVFFDTGAMYRSVAWLLQKEGVDLQDEQSLQKVIELFDFSIEQGEEKRYFVRGEEVTNLIRTPEISSFSSQVAAIPIVRERLVLIQRDFAKRQSAVFEGRDMGTVVFPDTDGKFFLTASSKIRAQRRYQELTQKFPEKTIDENEVLLDIEKRDHFDSTRKISPLKKTSDMIEINTSGICAEEVISKAYALVQTKMQKMGFLYRFIIHIVKPFFRIFYRLRVYGKEHFAFGPAIVAPNHVSFYDPPLVAVSSPEEIHFLARDSLFRFPLFGRLIRKLNAHPVAKGAKDAATLKQIMKLLKEGKKVLLFPEGSRSFDGTLQELQPGIGFLVYKTRCKILPVYIHGTFPIWGKHRAFPKWFGRVHCVFGSPISFEDCDSLDRAEFIETVLSRTKQALTCLQTWFQDGAKGSPP